MDISQLHAIFIFFLCLWAILRLSDQSFALYSTRFFLSYSIFHVNSYILPAPREERARLAASRGVGLLKDAAVFIVNYLIRNGRNMS